MSRVDELSKKRRSLQAKRHLRLLLIAALVLVTIASSVWLIVLIMTADREAPRLQFLQKAEMEEKESVFVIFIDDAVTVTSPDHGIFLPLLEEGERVAKDALVGLILPYDREQDATRYRALDQSVREGYFVLSGVADTTRHPQPIAPVDGRLRAAILAMTQLAVQDTGEALRQFDHAFLEAQSQASLFARADERQQALIGERDRLLDDLLADGRVVALRAHMTGELSFHPFSPIHEFDPVWGEYGDDPERAIAQLMGMTVEGEDRRYAKVSAGEPLLSLRRFSGRSMILWHPTTDKGGAIQKGSRVMLSLPGTSRLKNLEVTRVREEATGDWLWVSSDEWTGYQPLTAAIEGATLIASTVKGLSVPLRSLMDVDFEARTATLRKIKGGVTETVTVDIVAHDGRVAIIASPEGESRPLTEADLFVTNPWTAGDGVLID